MSDLISRNEVSNVIDELEVYTCGRPNAMKVEISVLQLQRFIDKLKNIPTAYDIDKVVEELEETMQDLSVIEILSHIDFDSTIQSGLDNFLKAYNSELLRIVKQGGVTDDVCAWKQTSTAKYKTSCGYKLEEYFDTKACYCKQCGKKIKVVD